MFINGIFRVHEITKEGTCKDTNKPWAHAIAFDFHSEYDEDAFVMLHFWGDDVDYIKRNMVEGRRIFVTGTLKFNKYMETQTKNVTLNIPGNPITIGVPVEVERCTNIIDVHNAKFIEQLGNREETANETISADFNNLTPEQIEELKKFKPASTTNENINIKAANNTVASGCSTRRIPKTRRSRNKVKDNTNEECEI